MAIFSLDVVHGSFASCFHSSGHFRSTSISGHRQAAPRVTNPELSTEVVHRSITSSRGCAGFCDAAPVGFERDLKLCVEKEQHQNELFETTNFRINEAAAPETLEARGGKSPAGAFGEWPVNRHRGRKVKTNRDCNQRARQLTPHISQAENRGED